MIKFIELLERKISGCDSLGGLEREKAVYQSVLKDYREQLTLTDVVHRRELLLCVCTEVHGTVRNSENELVCKDCYEPINTIKNYEKL